MTTKKCKDKYCEGDSRPYCAHTPSPKPCCEKCKAWTLMTGGICNNPSCPCHQAKPVYGKDKTNEMTTEVFGRRMKDGTVIIDEVRYTPEVSPAKEEKECGCDGPITCFDHMVIPKKTPTPTEQKGEWEEFDKLFPIKEFRDTGAWYACREWVAAKKKEWEDASDALIESYKNSLLKQVNAIRDEAGQAVKAEIRERIEKEISMWKDILWDYSHPVTDSVKQAIEEKIKTLNSAISLLSDKVNH